MVVVMAIIAIMLTIASMGLKNLNRGKGIPNAVDLSSGLLRETKAMAQARGRARLVIVNDPMDKTSPRRHLRYMAIMTDGDGDPETEDWVVEGNGLELPSGVYFAPELSKNADSGSASAFGNTTVQARLSKRQGGTRCNYVEFNSEGVMVWPEAGQKLVFMEGTMQPTDKEPRPASRDEKGRPKTVGGIVLHRLGNFSLIRTPEQVHGR